MGDGRPPKKAKILSSNHASGTHPLFLPKQKVVVGEKKLRGVDVLTTANLSKSSYLVITAFGGLDSFCPAII